MAWVAGEGRFALGRPSVSHVVLIVVTAGPQDGGQACLSCQAHVSFRRSCRVPVNAQTWEIGKRRHSNCISVLLHIRLSWHSFLKVITWT